MRPAHLEDLRRILIFGNGGTGKTSLARQVGAIIARPVMHLDDLRSVPGQYGIARDNQLVLNLDYARKVVGSAVFWVRHCASNRCVERRRILSLLGAFGCHVDGGIQDIEHLQGAFQAGTLKAKAATLRDELAVCEAIPITNVFQADLPDASIYAADRDGVPMVCDTHELIVRNHEAFEIRGVLRFNLCRRRLFDLSEKALVLCLQLFDSSRKLGNLLGVCRWGN